MANDAPLVSALVLTYNHEPFILTSLKSLAASDCSDVEIDVLDDGSADQTFAIVRDFAEASKLRVRASTQSHSKGRTSENSQKLVDDARGKYLLFMSGDDALAPNYPLNQMIEALEADESLVLALPRAIHFVQSDASQTISIYTPAFRALLHSGDPERVFLEHLCKQVSRLFLQGAVIRADFLKESGGFDVDLTADDYGFMMRTFAAMRRTRKVFRFFENSLWLYRVHPSNMHADPQRQQRVVMEVVAKYVPSEHWADFIWDNEPSENFASFEAWCEEIIRHFGHLSKRRVIPDAARRFAYRALARKDIKSLFKLATWKPTRMTTIGFVAPRLYRLLKF